MYIMCSLQTVTEEKYDVKRCVEEAAIIVTNNTEPRVSCTITLTSPIMRESSDGGISYIPTHPGNVLLHAFSFSLWHNKITTKGIYDQKSCIFSLDIV